MTKARAITNDIAKNSYTQRMIFRFLLIGLVLLTSAYFYLVASMTFNLTARKSLENTVANLTSQVNQLEISYLDKFNKADKAYAFSNGFVELPQNIFVSRDINHVAIR